MSDISLFKAFESAMRLSSIGFSIETTPFPFGPTASLFIYMSGAFKRCPSGATAKTAIASVPPFATAFVPSRGSTAMSIFGESACL